MSARVLAMTYELRIYHANPGKMTNLLKRFRDHTVELFARHGIESIGYWIDDAVPNDLVYLLKHAGSAEKNWRNFMADEDWISVKAASEVDGRLVESVESRYLTATDFSKLI